MNSSTYVTKDYIGQSHSECIRSADLSVMLINRDTGEQMQIIDKDGLICNFPGICKCQ